MRLGFRITRLSLMSLRWMFYNVSLLLYRKVLPVVYCYTRCRYINFPTRVHVCNRYRQHLGNIWHRRAGLVEVNELCIMDSCIFLLCAALCSGVMYYRRVHHVNALQL